MGELKIQHQQKMVLMGDSITDCGRFGTENALGTGYVNLFTKLIMTRYPARQITFLNKGIGGQRIVDLKERWTDDVIYHRPDYLSLLIGINDLHNFMFDEKNGVNPQVYEETYDYLLNRTRELLPKITLVLLDPFYISRENSGNTIRNRVLDLLPKYISVVHKMAKKYHTKLIETHKIFQIQLQYRDAETFCPEPVHPNQTGHLIIADALVNIFCK